VTRDEHIEYWVESAARDFQAMESLFAERHFVWSLFLGHLVIEKLLKAFHAKHSDSVPPRIHNLLKLAEDISLDLSVEQRTFLDEVTAFNIRARYPDFKDRFFHTATREFSEAYIGQIREFRKWLLQKIAE
jgi:HEPN domain-containing protein